MGTRKGQVGATTVADLALGPMHHNAALMVPCTSRSCWIIPRQDTMGESR